MGVAQEQLRVAAAAAAAAAAKDWAIRLKEVRKEKARVRDYSATFDFRFPISDFRFLVSGFRFLNFLLATYICSPCAFKVSLNLFRKRKEGVYPSTRIPFHINFK